MNPVIKKFYDVLEQDRDKYIKNWMITWEYQEKRKKAKKNYESDVISEFSDFNGKEDLIKWMNWYRGVNFPDFINNDEIHSLNETSLETDKRIISQLGLSYNFDEYNKIIGINNAHDYYIPQMLPSKNTITNILDFGAGYGRQANLWASDKRKYLAVDAIPNSYCLQNLYYSQLGVNLFDYLDSAPNFPMKFSENGIYHLPTWRMKSIPSESFDLVICIQVLPELNRTLVQWAIDEFRRILKPGGIFYIRDHGQGVKMALSFDFDNYIVKNGYSLEYKPHVADKIDIHGIPRIYRKNDPIVIKSQTKTTQQKTRELLRDVDYQTGGLLSKVSKQVRGK